MFVLSAARLNAAVLRPVARTIPPAVFGVATAITLPAIVAAIRGSRDLTAVVVLATVLAGAGLAFAVDDPAAATLASSPTSLPIRRALRLFAVGAVLAAACGFAAIVVQLVDDPTTPLGHLAVDCIPLLAAAAAVALAAACRAPTTRPVTSGFGAAMTSALTILFIGAMAQRYAVLPSLPPEPGWSRWWWVAAVGALLAVRSSREPSRG